MSVGIQGWRVHRAGWRMKQNSKWYRPSKSKLCQLTKFKNSFKVLLFQDLLWPLHTHALKHRVNYLTKCYLTWNCCLTGKCSCHQQPHSFILYMQPFCAVCGLNWTPFKTILEGRTYFSCDCFNGTHHFGILSDLKAIYSSVFYRYPLLTDSNQHRKTMQ